jgi:hypothetical protein
VGMAQPLSAPMVTAPDNQRRRDSNLTIPKPVLRMAASLGMHASYHAGAARSLKPISSLAQIVYCS